MLLSSNKPFGREFLFVVDKMLAFNDDVESEHKAADRLLIYKILLLPILK